jgi:uncharacterized protein
MQADVIGLMEIENDGFGEFSAVASLVNALNDADSQNQYAFVDFGVDKIGTDAITTALIYRADKVQQVGTAAITTDAPFDYSNRAPIAQSFKSLETEEVFTVAVAHLKSKGGCGSATGGNADQNDGQACWNEIRTAGANAFADWLNSKPTGVDDEDIILVGDMNAYAMEDPIRAFADKGLKNVVAELDGNTLGYSYSFSGRAGSLDHALVSPSLLNKVVSATDWHINADEPISLDYNVEFKSDAQQSTLYAQGPYRASDHDPVIVDIRSTIIAPPEPEPEVIIGEINNIGGWFWWKSYSFEIPQGYDELTVSLDGGWGDANLFVRHKRNPTLFRKDCASISFGNSESCSFTNPKEGKWRVRVNGAIPFGNVKLTYKATKYAD